jgi:RNA polymerase sigma-70 factor (ECF subfamily)
VKTEERRDGGPGWSAEEEAAVGRLVADYEPYLRAVVRRHLGEQLRPKFDSADVVQSVWVHVLHALRGQGWRLGDPDAVRALLATVARRRLISRVRRHRAAVERERPAGPGPEALAAAGQARPSEVAQAGELWQRMLALCPPAHRELLHLRRQGLTLNEVAARAGMHEGSVRRVFRRLARELALSPGAPP